MSRWKALPWVLGTALLAVSLVAAGLNNSPAGSVNPDKPAAASSGSGVGPTVIGTVDTACGVMAIHPPGVPGMASLVVKKVHVQDGKGVQAGDVLVEFDPSTVLENKTQAENAVLEAEWTADQARRKLELHPQVIEKAKLGVRKAESDLAWAEKAQKAVNDTLEENLNIATQSATDRTPLTEAQKELRRSRSAELQTANATVASAKFAVEAAKLDQKQADSATPLLEADLQKANAVVARWRASIAQATAVIESFKLKAQVAGTVEQVSVSEGMAVGPTARTPLLYLVPAGPRVVRAEVEAEFAHKIDSFVGKSVVICAGPNFADTYTGTARRVSGAFLPKRFGADSLVGNTTRVLECVIEITEPTSGDKPPLRPGQPVRVKFGQ